MMISGYEPGRKPVQRALSCRCGRPSVFASGLCATCYTLHRQDERYFGGQREAVLERDKYTCQGCGRHGGRIRSIGVHHRRPGVSKRRLMISLCPGCHARIHRTKVLRREMSETLKGLWRELNPHAPEQLRLELRGAA